MFVKFLEVIMDVNGHYISLNNNELSIYKESTNKRKIVFNSNTKAEKAFNLIFVGGEDYCKLDYEIQGTECSGTYKISNVQNVVGADVVDCKAEILESNGVYTKSSEGLRLDNKTTGESFAYEKMLN